MASNKKHREKEKMGHVSERSTREKQKGYMTQHLPLKHINAKENKRIRGIQKKDLGDPLQRTKIQHREPHQHPKKPRRDIHRDTTTGRNNNQNDTGNRRGRRTGPGRNSTTRTTKNRKHKLECIERRATQNTCRFFGCTERNTRAATFNKTRRNIGRK